MHLSNSFSALLQIFSPVFTAPSFATFLTIMTGWLLTSRSRFITECILSADATHSKHFSCFHRLFADAVWSLDQLCELLATLVVSTFLPAGVIFLAVDDTLVCKRGLKLFGAGMHYDPLRSSKKHTVTSWGHDWVTVSILVWGLPWCPTKVWALPIAFRLYKNKQGNTQTKPNPTPATAHQTRPQLAVELLSMVSKWFGHRLLCVCGDSLYGGKSVARQLPANMTLISKVDAKGALYDFAPARVPGQRGASLKKGKRLPSMQEWIDDASSVWEEMVFDTFGLHTRLAVKSRVCLYYNVSHTTPVKVVLTRDLEGKRPDGMYYTTLVSLSEREILTMYARRWATEVTYRDSKQYLGFGESANRTEKAVKRTAPMAMVLYTLVVLWAERGGHEKAKWVERVWYKQKEELSFGDLLGEVRRESWQEMIAGGRMVEGGSESMLNKLIDCASRAG